MKNTIILTLYALSAVANAAITDVPLRAKIGAKAPLLQGVPKPPTGQFLPGVGEAKYKIVCDFGSAGYYDPKVFPNQPTAGHHHTFMCNIGMTETVTNFAKLTSLTRDDVDYFGSAGSGGSLNMTSIWQPSMIKPLANGDAKFIKPFFSSIYYKNVNKYANFSTIMPSNFFYIAGDHMNTFIDGPAHKAQQIRYYCRDMTRNKTCDGPNIDNDGGCTSDESKTIPKCPGGVGRFVKRVLIGPDCARKNAALPITRGNPQQVRLDSADHKSHTYLSMGAYNQAPGSNGCPSNTDNIEWIRIPRVSVITYYKLGVPGDDNEDSENSEGWALSSDYPVAPNPIDTKYLDAKYFGSNANNKCEGGTHGCSDHFDYWSGWSAAPQARWGGSTVWEMINKNCLKAEKSCESGVLSSTKNVDDKYDALDAPIKGISE